MLTIYEKFALNQWLFDYPDDMSYDDILYEILDQDSELINPWQVVENLPRREIADMIEGTRICAEITFKKVMA
jgi:hypothetical protein